MTQISDHVYACHIADTHYMHPGGTNVYFIGDPSEEMLLIDTGEHDRSWTKQILEYWEGLGSPKIAGILSADSTGFRKQWARPCAAIRSSRSNCGKCSGIKMSWLFP